MQTASVPAEFLAAARNSEARVSPKLDKPREQTTQKRPYMASPLVRKPFYLSEVTLDLRGVDHLTPRLRALHAAPLARLATSLAPVMFPAAAGGGGGPGAIGSRVVDPGAWVGDWIKDRFKDAIVGGEMTEDWDAVFKAAQAGLPFYYGRPGCEWAAYQQGSSIISHLANFYRIGVGMARVWLNTLENLVTVGQGGLRRFLIEKTAEQVRNEIRKAFAGEPARIFETSGYSLGRACTWNVKAVMDVANERYEIYVWGDCRCKQIASGPGRTAPLRKYLVIVSGTARLVPVTGDDSGDAKLRLVATTGHLDHVAGNCDCDGSGKPIGDGALAPPRKSPPPGGVGGTPEEPELDDGCTREYCEERMDDLTATAEKYASDPDNEKLNETFYDACNDINRCKCDEKVPEISDEFRKAFADHCIKRIQIRKGDDDEGAGLYVPESPEGEPVSDMPLPAWVRKGNSTAHAPCPAEVPGGAPASWRHTGEVEDGMALYALDREDLYVEPSQLLPDTGGELRPLERQAETDNPWDDRSQWSHDYNNDAQMSPVESDEVVRSAHRNRRSR